MKSYANFSDKNLKRDNVILKNKDIFYYKLVDKKSG